MADEIILNEGEVPVDPIDPVEIGPMIIKEGNQHFEKVQIDLEARISEQEQIVASLQEQIDRANATIEALKLAR